MTESDERPREVYGESASGQPLSEVQLLANLGDKIGQLIEAYHEVNRRVEKLEGLILDLAKAIAGSDDDE